MTERARLIICVIGLASSGRMISPHRKSFWLPKASLPRRRVHYIKPSGLAPMPNCWAAFPPSMRAMRDSGRWLG